MVNKRAILLLAALAAAAAVQGAPRCALFFCHALLTSSAAVPDCLWEALAAAGLGPWCTFQEPRQSSLTPGSRFPCAPLALQGGGEAG